MLFRSTQVAENKLLIDSGLNISSFGQDRFGELYALDHTNGVVYKVTPPAAAGPAEAADFPRTLSATKCFASLSPLTPASGLVPYDVQSPLWSDGATKSRYVFVPNGQKIRMAGDGTLQFPDDTVLVKNFSLPIRSGGSSGNRLIETRFLVKRSSGFRGYTYRWNDAGSEAQLLGGASTRDVTLATDAGDEAYSYYFPGSGDCIRCHAPGTGGALGFDAGHLNFGAENQLTKLAASHVLDASTLPGDLHTLPSYPSSDDASATLDARARSYLHTQCAECHNKAFGTAQGNFDLRYALSFADTHVCNATPITGDLGVPGAKILKPGSPDQSLIWLRVHSLEKGKRMPPLASSRLDAAGDALLRQWIASVRACP